MKNNRSKLIVSNPFIRRDSNIAMTATSELNLSSRSIRSRKGKGSYNRKEKYRGIEC